MTPPHDPAELTIEPVDEGRSTRLVVGGELDLAESDKLAAAIEAHAAPGRAVVLDLRRLAFMDSTGLSTIVAAHRSAGRQGWDLAVICPPGAVRRVFDLTDMGSVLRFVETSADV